MKKELTRRGFVCSLPAINFLIPQIDISILKKKSREDILSELNRLVEKYIILYGTCSQTSFQALNEVFGLKADIVTDALSPFPGIALRGETCGAVSGGLCALALSFNDRKNKKNVSDKPAQEFCDRFEKEFGSTRCRDVIRSVTGKEYVIEKPEDYNQVGALDHCTDVIINAVSIAADIILSKA